MEASSKPKHDSLFPQINLAKTGPDTQRGHGDSDLDQYTLERFMVEADRFLTEVRYSSNLGEARERLSNLVLKLRIENSMTRRSKWSQDADRTRDCSRSMLCLLSANSDEKTGFSVTKALMDLAQGRPREDLQPGFFAEVVHLIWGVEARARDNPMTHSLLLDRELSGRDAALERTKDLDRLWKHVTSWMDRYEHGLKPESQDRRRARRQAILEALGAEESDWQDWRWHVANVGKDPETLGKMVHLSADELSNITTTCENRIPFGATPYYLSLMDDESSIRDQAVRYQVFPPENYVTEMTENRSNRSETFDFMQERDTSPVDLVTRRYPGIAILKPYNTCPQICVYCQRNWEIDQVLAPDALAPEEKIEQAVDWIEDHPSIHDLLITGGDPFLQDDEQFDRLLERVCRVKPLQRVRLGTRSPGTLPMRITDKLAATIGKYRETGLREIAVVTHVEHPYEVTPEMGAAVERLRLAGIPVYNQLVYTYFVSRRFEASLLRVLLRRIGIEPYYTFLPKGKSETRDYQVPLSRLLQEQTEEARLLPGLSRTDEAVYNVPRLGKNYLRATKSRDLLTILPNGTRVYEFHPWEEKISEQASYIGEITPILTYLKRIEAEGNAVSDYESIWYYY